LSLELYFILIGIESDEYCRQASGRKGGRCGWNVWGGLVAAIEKKALRGER